MTDIKSKDDRSRNMAAIKGKNTKPEQYICHELFSRGYRYRKNVSYIEGHPDIFLRKYNTAIFVHGCFWHHHDGCKYAYNPKTRVQFWLDKFDKNIKRDLFVQDKLLEEKVKCLVIWECTVNKMKRDIDYNKQTMDKIVNFLNSEKMKFEL